MSPSPYHLYCTIPRFFDFRVASVLSSLLMWLETDKRGAQTPRVWLRVTDTHRIPERRWILRQQRLTSPLQPLSPRLAAAGRTAALAPGLMCTLKLAVAQETRSASGDFWAGRGGEGRGSSGRPFLGHVAAPSNQSAEVGVHPEDPGSAAWKSVGCLRPAGLFTGSGWVGGRGWQQWVVSIVAKTSLPPRTPARCH